jgi:TRAP-type C4-dicarboxylate transport system substrate-binding protein
MSIMPYRNAAKAVVVSIALVAAFAVTPVSAKKIILKIGHPLPPKTGLQVWALDFKARLEKRVPGVFDAKIFPTSQLGAMPRMIEGTQLGTIEMITIPPAFFTGVDQRYGVVTAPGIFDGIAHGQRTMNDPEFKKIYWPIGEPKGLKQIGMSCEAPTDYAFVKPITKLSDFKGRKLRVFGSKLEIETLRRVGATGVPMPLSEVIPAIQRKVIDGNKAGMPVFVPFKYQTIAKHVLIGKQSIICINRMVSKTWFDGLSKNLQQVLVEEAGKADTNILAWNIAIMKKFYGIWKKTGGVLVEFSAEDNAEFRRRLSTVGEDVFKNQPKVLAMYRLMKKVANRRRAK